MIKPAPHTARRPRSKAIGMCQVLHCSIEADSVWEPPAQHLVEAWPVCARHRAELVAGGHWALRRGRFPTFGRWLLMGDDLTTWRQPKT